MPQPPGRLMLRMAAAILVTLCAGGAQSADRPDLELIMSDPDWIGNAPTGFYWSDSAGEIYFDQKRVGENFSDLYVVPAAGGEPRRVAPAEESKSSNASRAYNAARTMVAWIHRGDIMVRDLTSGQTRQLTRTTAEETSPMFMADGRSVAFVRDKLHFVYDTETGMTSEAADLRFEKHPDEQSFDTLREQQMRNLETLREDKRRAEALKTDEEARQHEDPAGAPLPIYLGEDYTEVTRSLSPSGRYLLVTVTDDEVDEGRAGMMPNYVTEDGYTSITETRTRVGRNLPAAQQLLLVDLLEGKFETVDYAALPGIDDDPLEELREGAVDWHVERGADREEVEKAVEAPETRPLTVERIVWNNSGSLAAVQLRSVDNKDRWLATIDPEKPLATPQHRLTDEAWINWDYNEFGFLPDGRTLWYLSEESGFSHLYTKRVNSRRTRQLTSGEFVVREPELNPQGSHFYVVTNRTHPGNYEVYRVAASGGDLEQVTELGGVVQFRLSPAGDRLLLSRSWLDRHEDLYVKPSTAGGEVVRLTDTVSQQFKSIDWVVPEILPVPSSQVDKPIYTKLYLPPDYRDGNRYPAVMFVHGAGYTQNSHMGWPYYFREFMFHTILANEGFVVIDMDYRASQGYGRDWRTAIYRNMGRPELEDFKDGIDWLVENYGVDRSRIGIYGGSYGGFMTFMSLFLEPDLFAAGAALRPVADWMHYNHTYTSNILNTPVIDPEAYHRSSPINYVQNLEKPLLIASGMQDDNVFFQDAVLVVQRLIELKKENFELAVYPLDPHGFVHPNSWLDEYRRIYKLMHEHLE
ncbi:MAG TPA: prolyl oligopeptidase family serine peptidase [Woeseiaceae bacterium]|nr:prolyl oligopeptidase family serine peptidase [Woeseiaceae bacterium]